MGRKVQGSAATAVALWVGCAALLGCSAKTPKGQVLAVVNGQEITAQDLGAEARARHLKAGMNQQALLQEVVGRVLLSQNAHARKLDRYPGYPSDIARLQQSFLADKVLAADVKPPSAPTDAQAQAFIAAHPSVFGQRARIKADLLRYRPGPASAAIGDPDTMQAAIAKLKSLNIPYDQGSQTFDTAALPPELASRLMSVSAGQYNTFVFGPTAMGVVVTGREAVSEPADQQLATAKQLIMRQAAEREVAAEVAKLRAQGKIAYQNGWGPSAAAPATTAGGPTKAS